MISISKLLFVWFFFSIRCLSLIINRRPGRSTCRRATGAISFIYGYPNDHVYKAEVVYCPVNGYPAFVFEKNKRRQAPAHIDNIVRF